MNIYWRTAIILLVINLIIFLCNWFIYQNPLFWEYEIFFSIEGRSAFLFLEILLLFVAWSLNAFFENN